MKKSPIFLLSYFCIVLSAAILLTGSLGSNPIQDKTTSQDTATQYFTVRAEGDRVVVCKNDETEPLMELDISLRTLPEYDREQIQMGMRLKDMTELEQFIEDFEG